MKRIKRAAPKAYPVSWTISTELDVINSRGTFHLAPGITLGIKGEPGRFRFVDHVFNTANDSEWITVIGGTGKGTSREVTMWRSFHPERITRIYRERIKK
jgi:hypothetical protein